MKEILEKLLNRKRELELDISEWKAKYNPSHFESFIKEDEREIEILDVVIMALVDNPVDSTKQSDTMSK